MTGTGLCALLSLDDFLCFDGPTGVIVAQDDSRTNFFHHLGLQERSYRHRMLYRKMKEEAKAGMRRLFDNPASLDSSVARDKTVTPPYSASQMSELAFQREVEHIYETASRQTKGIYDLTRTANGHNWVIRWMLWHVVQARFHQDFRVSSIAADFARSTSSPCSITTDWSPAPGHSPVKTRPAWMTADCSFYNLSDSDEWDDDYDVHRGLAVQSSLTHLPSPPKRKSVFWDHVMT